MLADYEYVWRLDSDSFLLGPPAADPFLEMAVANATYAWIHAFRDEPLFVTGLWDLTRDFLRARGIDEDRVHSWVPGGKSWPETPMCFATNCFLARRSWSASDPRLSYSLTTHCSLIAARCSPHCSLLAVRHTPHTTHHTLHTIHHIPHTTHHTPHTAHHTRHTTHGTPHTTHCTLHTPHSTLRAGSFFSHPPTRTAGLPLSRT